MDNLRNVNNDILRDWLEYRETTDFAFTDEEDRKHHINMDVLSEKILNNVSEQNYAFVQKQLEQIEDNYMDYINYWNEKYYRNGFCDAIQLIVGTLYS